MKNKNYRILLAMRKHWEAQGDTREVKAIDRSIAIVQEKMNEEAKVFMAERQTDRIRMSEPVA